MAHNDFVRPSGVWVSATVPTPGDMRRFDQAQFQAVNGDAGGSWAPASPIAIGGSGLALTGGNHSLQGGALTLRGGRVVLGASTYPTFKTAAIRSMSVPLRRPGLFLLSALGAPTMPFLPQGQGDAPGLVIASALPSGQSSILVFPIPRRFCHHGATLSSGAINLAIGLAHVAVPVVQPTAYVVRNDWYLGPACLQFAPSSLYNAPGLFIPSSAYGANGYFYAITTSGTAGAEPGTWPTTLGATVTTGSVTFTCAGTTWASSGFADVGDPGEWASLHTYARGMPIQPNPASGQWFYATTGGTTSNTQPTWPTTYGAVVTDGTVTWQNQGSMLPILSGAMTASTPGGYYAAGASQSFAMAGVVGGPSVIDTTAFSYHVLVADESGSGALSPSFNRYITAELNYTGIADMRPE